MISIVIPTIKGREHWAEQCQAAYEATTTVDHEFIIVRDEPTVGVAWTAGMRKAKGAYVHLTNDDITPHPGWHEAAIEKVKAGLVPCPRVLNSDGSLQSCGDDVEHADEWPAEFTRVPFLSKEWAKLVGPIIPTHYFTDNWVSHRLRQHGIPTVVATQYLLTHHIAPEGRVDDRFDADRAAYEQYVSGATPWP